MGNVSYYMLWILHICSVKRPTHFKTHIKTPAPFMAGDLLNNSILLSKTHFPPPVYTCRQGWWCVGVGWFGWVGWVGWVGCLAGWVVGRYGNLISIYICLHIYIYIYIYIYICNVLSARLTRDHLREQRVINAQRRISRHCQFVEPLPRCS